MLKDDKKGISPVLAVLLMIAVVIATGLVTYTWVVTYFETTMDRAGHAIQIQSIDWTVTQAIVHVQNVGSGTVDITETYVDGGLVTAGGLGTVTEGTTTPITFAGTFASGDEVHIKVVCEDGAYSEGTYKVETI